MLNNVDIIDIKVNTVYKEKGVTLRLIDYLDNRRYIENVVDLGNICL